MAAELKYAVERPNLVVGFFALFGFIAAAALRAAWRGTFHNLLQGIAAALDVSILSKHPFGGLADKFRNLDNNVYNWLGRMKDSCGHAFITLVLWIAMQVVMVVVAIAALSYELLRYAHVIGHRTSVTVVKKTVNVITKPLAHQAAKGAVAHDSRVPALQREIDTLRGRVKTQEQALAKVQAITVPVPIPYPQPRRAPVPAPVPVPHDTTLPKVSDLTRAWDAIRKRLGSITKLGTVAGLVGLTAAVLGRLGLGWARCSKVRRLGRGVCGLDESLLESLLADALLVVGAVSIVEFARELQTVEGVAVDALRGFVAEL